MNYSIRLECDLHNSASLHRWCLAAAPQYDLFNNKHVFNPSDYSIRSLNAHNMKYESSLKSYIYTLNIKLCADFNGKSSILFRYCIFYFCAYKLFNGVINNFSFRLWDVRKTRKHSTIRLWLLELLLCWFMCFDSAEDKVDTRRRWWRWYNNSHKLALTLLCWDFFWDIYVHHKTQPRLDYCSSAFKWIL